MASTRTLTVQIVGDETSAKKALAGTETAATKAGTTLEGVSGRVGGAFGKLDTLLASFGLPFSGALGAIGTKLEETEGKASSAFQKIATAGKIAALGIAAGVIAVGVESFKLADSFEKAQAQLENSLKNTGQSFKALSPQIDAAVKAGEKFGVNATETEGALAKAQVATGDFTKSQQLLVLAEDVSAKTHKDLAASMLLVIKASEGNIGALKRQGIDLNITAGGAKALAAAQAALTKIQGAGTVAQDKYNLAVKEHGVNSKQAAAAMANMVKIWGEGETAQKKLNDTQNSGKQILDALTQKFGGAAAASADTFAGKAKALQAQLEDLGIKIGVWLIPKIQDLIAAVMDVITWFEKHQTVAEALGIVIGTVLVAAITAYIVQLGIAAAETLAFISPVLLVIGVIALWVGAIYELWTNWDKVLNWIANHPAFAVLIGVLGTIITGGLLPITFAAIELAKNWDEVWGAISATASDAADRLVIALQPIIATLEWIWNRIQDVKDAFNSLPGKSSTSQGGSGPIDFTGIFGASGGIINRPTLLLAGEAGPEALVPLDRSAGNSSLPSGGFGGGGTDTLVIPIQIDGKTVTEVVVKNLNSPGGPRISQRALV